MTDLVVVVVVVVVDVLFFRAQLGRFQVGGPVFRGHGVGVMQVPSGARLCLENLGRVRVPNWGSGKLFRRDVDYYHHVMLAMTVVLLWWVMVVEGSSRECLKW